MIWFSFPFSFQFFTRLAAVFADDVADFVFVSFNSLIKRRLAFMILRLQIRTLTCPGHGLVR